MIRITPIRFFAVTSLLAVSACGDRDPYARTDVWRPTGANMGNIAVMAADPRDLIAGHGVRVTDTKASSIAIDHIWNNEPQPMAYNSQSGSSSAGSGGSAPPASPIGAPGAGGGSAQPGS